MKQIALNDLVTYINEAHNEAEGHAKQAVMIAIKTGEYLNQAKSKLKHGGWETWIKQNLSFSKRKAQTYMRLANHREEIEKSADSALLSIDGALSLISADQYSELSTLDASREWVEVINSEY